MDAFASVFEILVLSLTGISLAALVSFIVWDALAERKAAAYTVPRKTRAQIEAVQFFVVERDELPKAA